jgi:hypothetical protein
MDTLYFIIITVLGGLFALFFASGWASYKHKKIPETPILFRWFIAGIFASGLAAYTWIFGYGGNVSEVVEAIGGALDVGTLISGNESTDATVSRSRADTESITIGLAPF